MKIPILIFAYNRPSEIQRVLESLERQVDHDKFDVFVFIDGHRDSSDKFAVREVYNVCCEFGQLINFLFAEPSNIGLRNNILKGINHIKDSYDSFIVLEDDIILSPGALSYMSLMLNQYSNSDKIGHINLWNFPFIDADQPYLSWHMHCWGWGSWTRLWRCSVVDELLIQPDFYSKVFISKFFSTTHYSHFYGNLIGVKRTWAVLWMMRLVRRKLLSVSPPYSLVENIGLKSGDNIEYLDFKQKSRGFGDMTVNLASRISGLLNDFKSWFYTIYLSPKLALLKTLYLVVFK